MAVEVFKTTITDKHVAAIIIKHLLTRYLAAKINFDFDDTDNVLRIENNSAIMPEEVVSLILQQGYFGEVLC